jgi:hypothetical protein
MTKAWKEIERSREKSKADAEIAAQEIEQLRKEVKRLRAAKEPPRYLSYDDGFGGSPRAFIRR